MDIVKDRTAIRIFKQFVDLKIKPYLWADSCRSGKSRYPRASPVLTVTVATATDLNLVACTLFRASIKIQELRRLMPSSAFIHGHARGIL